MRAFVMCLCVSSACAIDPTPTAPPSSAPTPALVLEARPRQPAQPPSCSHQISGPVPVGGGNSTCTMSVTTTVTCPQGQAGRLAAVFGEVGGPTLYAASADAAYLCGVPVVLERVGIDCGADVAADVGWYAPDGSGPNACP